MRSLKMSLLVLVILTFATGDLFSQGSFAQQQLRHARVKNAKEEKDFTLRHFFESKGLPYEVKNVYLRAFKQEGIMEVWIQQDVSSDYIKLKEYLFCESSGKLGPKRKQGDEQIPEGFYFISEFNPTSSYHLGLKVNYPNPSDRQLSSHRGNLGGSIFIHGDCLTIGCIPITDDKIKELYWLTVKAKDNGQHHIPVHIYPFKFDHMNYGNHEYYDEEDLQLFWDNLSGGYYYFERHRRPPFVHIKNNGKYAFF